MALVSRARACRSRRPVAVHISSSDSDRKSEARGETGLAVHLLPFLTGIGALTAPGAVFVPGARLLAASLIAYVRDLSRSTISH